MLLHLRTGSRGSSGVDVAVALPDDATIDDLARGLVRELSADQAGAASTVMLSCDRLGTLRGADAVAESGLRSGDTVGLGRAAGAGDDSRRPGRASDGNNSRAAIEMQVVGGPQAGRRVSLAPGTHTIGRDHSCELRFKDPSLSRRHAELLVAPGASRSATSGRATGRRSRAAGYEGTRPSPSQRAPR